MALKPDQTIILYRGKTHLAEKMAGGLRIFCNRAVLQSGYKDAPTTLIPSCASCGAKVQLQERE